nr:tetratricopeptide repeat protein [Okeania sp. SIO3I5]
MAVLYLKGNILTTNFQEDEQAIAVYNKAIQLKSDLADASMGKGEAFYRNGNSEKAREAAQEAVKLKPNNPEVLNFLNALEKNRLPPHSMEWIPNQIEIERRNYSPRQPPNLFWSSI